MCEILIKKSDLTNINKFKKVGTMSAFFCIFILYEKT